MLARAAGVSGCEKAFEAFGLYLPRFLSDQRDGVAYEPFAAGLARLAGCAEVTRSMGAWLEDALWMTGYFSVGVWSSIWLAVAEFPRPKQQSERAVGLLNA